MLSDSRVDQAGLPGQELQPHRPGRSPRERSPSSAALSSTIGAQFADDNRGSSFCSRPENSCCHMNVPVAHIFKLKRISCCMWGTLQQISFKMCLVKISYVVWLFSHWLLCLFWPINFKWDVRKENSRVDSQNGSSIDHLLIPNWKCSS